MGSKEKLIWTRALADQNKVAIQIPKLLAEKNLSVIETDNGYGMSLETSTK